MKCRADNNGNEIILTNAKFGDVIAIIQIWLNKNKEICFFKPEEERADPEKIKVEYHE